MQFPPHQSYDEGWLDVGDGHQIHWALSGHPGAPTALFIHGGPGASGTAADRRWFNPQQWRVLNFDQRGCGQSRAQDLLHANTTAHLLADMEALRQHLGVKRWLLFGGSWGATLALAYAQVHPQRVSGLVLRGVFTATRTETCWLYGARGAAARHPQAWQRLCAAAGSDPKANVLDAMHQRLQSNDQVALTAAHAWWAWEHDLMDAETTLAHAPRASVDHAHALPWARIGVHYARNAWFLDEGQLLANAARLHGIPGVIVQGQRDLITPASAARALHAAWPQAQLFEVASAGHASSHPGMARHLIQATESMAATAEETLHVRVHTA